MAAGPPTIARIAKAKKRAASRCAKTAIVFQRADCAIALPMATGSVGDRALLIAPNSSGLSLLEAQQNQVRAAAHAEFIQQIGDVEFDRALRNIQSAGNFFVGKILEQGVGHFPPAGA